MYGDITHDKRYVPELMQLGTGGYYARNSKGESKLIKEVGWAGKDEHPTHLILQFTSSMGGAFVGSPGNKLWIDNVNLVYWDCKKSFESTGKVPAYKNKV